MAADPGAGKTALLHMIAQAAADMHTPADVQFGVLTNYPDEWGHLAELEHCVGIFPTYHDSAIDFINSLSGWAHANKGSQQSILLLLDDLETMQHIDFDTRQTLRWLLLRGPSRQGLAAHQHERRACHPGRGLAGCLPHARLRQHPERPHCQTLTGIPGSTLKHLQSGLQFALREDDDWLKFWIPDVSLVEFETSRKQIQNERDLLWFDPASGGPGLQ